jgi:alkanesulfonate monooxygenase SsuD/methylene tetrahydromethanopterin reductase-like flavin-dependent oxidoreductase (luciferase family)
MKIGMRLPTREPFIDGEFLTEWARRADAAGFSSLAVTDRVVHHAKEPLVALAVAAGVTSRIRLCASAIVVPSRETTLLARQAASLDALSDGRFTLGVGIGVRTDDYTATGTEFHTRGRRVEEQLARLRRIWAGEPADPERGIGPIGPAPVRPGRPEVLLGGYVEKVAGRIARWGDGYLAPVGGDPASNLALWERIRAAWREAGRPGEPRWVTGAYYALGPDAEAVADRYIQENYGFKPELARRIRSNVPTSPQQIYDAVRRLEDLGADEYVLRPCTTDFPTLDAITEVVTAMPA